MTQESTVATHLSNVGVIVLIPQSFTDEEKSMYLAFRDEMRSQIAWELEYDYYWMDHFSGDSETLIAHYDDRRR
jgi:hypothetical protein